MMRIKTACLISAPLYPILLVFGCGNMRDQPRIDPLEPSLFFEDGLSARPLSAGTIPRGGLREDSSYHQGQREKQLIREIPVEATLTLLQRGRERFNIFCAPCHGETGEGNGMIAQRGFPEPPTYHDDRLRGAPAGHLFDVISNGYGKMAPFATQIPVKDRWAIISYIRALQLSQNAPFEGLPEAEQKRLEAVR